MKGMVPVGGVWKQCLLLCRGKNSCCACRSVNGRKWMCQFIHNWLLCAKSWQRWQKSKLSQWCSYLCMLRMFLRVWVYILSVCTHLAQKCKSIIRGQEGADVETAHTCWASTCGGGWAQQLPHRTSVTVAFDGTSTNQSWFILSIPPSVSLLPVSHSFSHLFALIAHQR